MADVLKIVFLILGSLIVFISYWLAAEALFPAIDERARDHYQRGVKVTLIGLAGMLPLLGLGAVVSLAAHPAIKALSVVLYAVPVLLGLLGSAGLSQRIGRGLPSLTDEQQPWRRTLRGSIVLSFTFLLPFIGWFIIIPWTLVSGFGAAFLSLSSKQKLAPAQLPVPAPAPLPETREMVG